MIFACKKCKKCFRKDMNEFEDSDEYCPHCDNRACAMPRLATKIFPTDKPAV